jgi:hypothetical protein
LDFFNGKFLNFFKLKKICCCFCLFVICESSVLKCPFSSFAQFWFGCLFCCVDVVPYVYQTLKQVQLIYFYSGALGFGNILSNLSLWKYNHMCLWFLWLKLIWLLIHFELNFYILFSSHPTLLMPI